MSEVVKFQCTLGTTSSAAPLSFEALLNGQSVFKLDHVTDNCQVTFDIPDTDDTKQTLQLVMSGKTTEHTQVDGQGNITADAMLTIDTVSIDGVDITQLLNETAEYAHDFNGTQDPTKDKFYGAMGCNGSVTLEFTTPFYLWLLEHM